MTVTVTVTWTRNLPGRSSDSEAAAHSDCWPGVAWRCGNSRGPPRARGQTRRRAIEPRYTRLGAALLRKKIAPTHMSFTFPLLLRYTAFLQVTGPPALNKLSQSRPTSVVPVAAPTMRSHIMTVDVFRVSRWSTYPPHRYTKSVPEK